MHALRKEPNTDTIELVAPKPVPLVWLEAIDGAGRQIAPLPLGSKVVVGSAPNCELPLGDPAVSKRHCVVHSDQGGLWVQDLGSRNGLHVGGARVSAARLHVGSSFVVGHVIVSVRNDEWPDEASQCEPLPGLIGHSAPMLRLAATVRQLAAVSLPVVVQGPTGSGKELVAHALHKLGPRASKPLVALNAGALPRDLAAAELFGHERGAFTGAHARRDGAIVQAHGGTLFLDEVGELCLDTQVKLLRVLEEGEVRPLGARCVTRVDVRVVAASWAQLDAMVTQGTFREDLYHRLAVGLVRVPSLDERPSDIGPLARWFLDQHRAELGAKSCTSEVLAALATRHWPGNVRQLRNVVLRAALIAKGNQIELADLHEATAGMLLQGRRMSPSAAQALVRACNGSVSAAARRCDVPRSTFRGWLKPCASDSKNTADS